MKTTLIQEPAFTWVSDDLFCGEIFLCRLYSQIPRKCQHYFRLQHVAFSDAISEIGWDKWNGEPFDLKTASPNEAMKLVESFYRTVFDRMEFKTTVK